MGKPARAAARSKPSTTLSTVRAVAGEAERVSAADKRRAEELLSLIGRRKQQISEAFYEIGLALRELQKKKLHVALGFSSFAAMLQARDVMSAAQAFKLIKLVSAVPRDQALAMGQEKAFALVRYAEATPEIDTAQLLLETGTLPGGKRLADASVRELDAAVKGMSGAKKKGKRSPDELAAHHEAATTQAALRKLGAKDAVVTAARISGEWWLRAQVRVESSALLRSASAGTASPATKTSTAKPSKTRKSSKDPAPKPSKSAAPKPARPTPAPTRKR